MGAQRDSLTDLRYAVQGLGTYPRSADYLIEDQLRILEWNDVYVLNPEMKTQRLQELRDKRDAFAAAEGEELTAQEKQAILDAIDAILPAP
jgi:hypothetical protein